MFTPSFSILSRLTRSLTLVFCGLIFLASGEKAQSKKKSIPIIAPEPKKEETVNVTTNTNAKAENGGAFQELNFSKTLVIEGRVEKPQVQFTLLKEPPPEKEIKFETSFMQNILKMDRENTFKIHEAISAE